VVPSVSLFSLGTFFLNKYFFRFCYSGIMMKKILNLFIIIFVVSTVQGNVLLSEDFESAGLPAGWTVVDNSDGSSNPAFSNTTGHDGSGGNGGEGAHIGDNIDVGPNNTPGGWLQSPISLLANTAFSMSVDVRIDNEDTIDDAQILIGDFDAGKYVYIFLAADDQSLNNDVYSVTDKVTGAKTSILDNYGSAYLDSKWYEIVVTWTPTAGTVGTLSFAAYDPIDDSLYNNFEITEVQMPDFVQFGFGTANDRASFDNIEINVPPARLIEPADGETLYIQFPHFDWEHVVDINNTRVDRLGHYDIEIAQNGDFSNPYISDQIEAVVSRYVPNKPLPYGDWSWRYRYVNHSGVESSWNTYTFTRPEIPQQNIVYVDNTMSWVVINQTINNAFSSARIYDKPVVVKFKPGVYEYNASKYSCIELSVYPEHGVRPPAFIIDGQGSRVIIDGDDGFLLTSGVENVEIMNFEVDYEASTINSTFGIVESIDVPNRKFVIHVPNRSQIDDTTFGQMYGRYFVTRYSKTRLGQYGNVMYETGMTSLGNDRYEVTLENTYEVGETLPRVQVGDLYNLGSGRQTPFIKIKRGRYNTAYNITTYWVRSQFLQPEMSRKCHFINCRALRRFGRVVACNNDGILMASGVPFPISEWTDQTRFWFDECMITGTGDDVFFVGSHNAEELYPQLGQAVFRNGLIANSRRHSAQARPAPGDGGLFANNRIHNCPPRTGMSCSWQDWVTPIDGAHNMLFINNVLYNSGRTYMAWPRTDDTKAHQNVAFVNNTFYKMYDPQQGREPTSFYGRNFTDVYYQGNELFYCNEGDPSTAAFFYLKKFGTVDINNNTINIKTDNGNPLVELGEQAGTVYQSNNSINVVSNCYKDSDGDGIPDSDEGTADLDGDGIPNYLDDDADGDWIIDLVETAEDADGDGIPNYKDTDSDGDGIDDKDENPHDSDGDGIANYLDIDSNGNGIIDGDDGTGDADNDGLENFLDLDFFCAADLDGDDDVDLADFAWFAKYWHRSNCSSPQWCGGSDFDQNTVVDFSDLQDFVEFWLWE
jgi:hypothetical protein